VPKRRGSSRRWLDEHERDPFVQKARREGRVARSAYKLIEIDERDRLLEPGMVVVDLGAAPGGWSAYAAERVGPSGRVVAVDLLPIEPIVGVEFILGDFDEMSVLEAVRSRVNRAPVGVVMSDMAPNFSGMRASDQPRAMALTELALDFAVEALEENGSFVSKVFQGEGFEEFLQLVRSHFRRVVMRKPDASRARSREQYVVARAFKGG
jgi:23S rRNA (uridine2552-2'-O)-methyltransferase